MKFDEIKIHILLNKNIDWTFIGLAYVCPTKKLYVCPTKKMIKNGIVYYCRTLFF